MKRQTLLFFTFVLTLFGLADAVYLTDKAMTGTPLTCNIAGLDGCNVVAQSAYSYLFGIPLALYGVFFYAVFLVLALVALFRPTPLSTRGLALLGTVGMLASIVFLYIQLVLIQALCIYCLGSAVVALLLFVTTLLALRRPGIPTTPHSEPQNPPSTPLS